MTLTEGKSQLCHRTNWVKKNRENIEIILVEENIKTKEEICSKEMYYISKYKKDGYDLVNTINGGEGWFGTKFSEEHKLNISKNHADVSGEKNPMFGKTHSKESMDKIKQKIKLWCKKGGLSKDQREKLKKIRSGHRNPNVKLTVENVLDIRKKYSEGNITHKELASQYGVNDPAIFKIINRLTWKHI